MEENPSGPGAFEGFRDAIIAQSSPSLQGAFRVLICSSDRDGRDIFSIWTRGKAGKRGPLIGLGKTWRRF